MISLPKEPKGEQYEDAVASFIRSMGYFVDTRLILHSDGREILELDLVATPANENSGNKILVDAKSGKTGFADIFKIYGWRIYLKIPVGCIVRHKTIPSSEKKVFDRYGKELAISAREFSLEKPDGLCDVFPEIIEINDKQRGQIFTAGWYAATIERICYHEFNKFRTSNSNMKIVEDVRQYDRACRIAFFDNDPLNRVKKLYDAFKNAPGISGQCINYISQIEKVDETRAQDMVFDTPKYLWVQYAMMLEHRARIQIIKNGVEVIAKYSPNEISKNGIVDLVPDNFLNGLELLRNHKFRYELPYLLHLFIEILGGYYITYDKFDSDLAMISDVSNIPSKDIVDCLQIINEFFPTPKGWFLNCKNELFEIKYFPAVWRGIGSFARHGYLFKDYYNDIAPKMGWLLSKYHNVAYNTLLPVLEVRQ